MKAQKLKTVGAKSIYSIILMVTVSASPLALADAERYLDRKGDRVENRLDRKGDRIDQKLDRRSHAADRAGKERLAEHLDRKGDVIDHRLDRKGERIDRLLDHKGQTL